MVCWPSRFRWGNASGRREGRFSRVDKNTTISTQYYICQLVMIYWFTQEYFDCSRLTDATARKAIGKNILISTFFLWAWGTDFLILTGTHIFLLPPSLAFALGTPTSWEQLFNFCSIGWRIWIQNKASNNNNPLPSHNIPVAISSCCLKHRCLSCNNLLHYQTSSCSWWGSILL